MDLIPVAGELREALGTIPGLRVPVWGFTAVQAPAAIVAVPDRVQFDLAYRRGADKYEDLPIVILVGNADERSSILAASAYLAGSGPQSVKAALEGHDYAGVCDVVNVVWAEFDEPKYAGTDYLAVIFHTDIVGSGE